MAWCNLTKTDLEQISVALPALSAQLTTAIAEDQSEAASLCRDQALDNDEFTPEWDGAVSFCDDGKAWVMTWQLVDNPCAEHNEEEEND